MEAKRKPKENERDTDHEDCLSTHKVRLESTEAIFLLKKNHIMLLPKSFSQEVRILKLEGKTTKGNFTEISGNTGGTDHQAVFLHVTWFYEN